MRNNGKKFEWNQRAQKAFENKKRDWHEAPVLGMPKEKSMYILDIDASVDAICVILYLEWGKSSLSDCIWHETMGVTENKYDAPKAGTFAVVTSVEKIAPIWEALLLSRE